MFNGLEKGVTFLYSNSKKIKYTKKNILERGNKPKKPSHKNNAINNIGTNGNLW